MAPGDLGPIKIQPNSKAHWASTFPDVLSLFFHFASVMLEMIFSLNHEVLPSFDALENDGRKTASC